MKNLLQPPPGILDLNLWNPSYNEHDRHHAEALDLQPHPWSQLPEHLLHSTLAWLPFQSILRFRSVSREWKCLFDSPAFHHFPSYAPHVPSWIFFFGTRYRHRRPDLVTDEESDTEIYLDDGGDDDGFVFESPEQGSDEDLENLVSVHDDGGDAQDAMRHTSEHGDIDDLTMHVHNLSMEHGGHGHEDTQGAAAEKDQTRVTDSEPFEELLLIFDCETESWRPPIAMPTGFKTQEDYPDTQNFFTRFLVCSSQEHILIPTCYEVTRYFLFNPGASLCKELPPCITSHDMKAIGLSVEMVAAPTEKIVQVVVLGQIDDMYVVESFSSNTGTWSICGYLQPSDDLFFMQNRMVFYKGSFYLATTKEIMKLDIVQGGQSMEYTFQEIPDLPNMFLAESRLLACTNSMYMVGVTYTLVSNSTEVDDWDILIWEYLPHVADDAGWKFQAKVPKPILDYFFGETELSKIDSLAHGDLIFLARPNRQRFLIYDLRTQLWRFSAKSKWFLGTMSFSWEPLLRN